MGYPKDKEGIWEILYPSKATQAQVSFSPEMSALILQREWSLCQRFHRMNTPAQRTPAVSYWSLFSYMTSRSI